jgi:hypothetical protein
MLTFLHALLPGKVTVYTGGSYVNITNYSCPEVSYSKLDTSPPTTSLSSLSEMKNLVTNKERGSTSKEHIECVALRTRNKTVYMKFFLMRKNFFNGEGAVCSRM